MRSRPVAVGFLPAVGRADTPLDQLLQNQGLDELTAETLALTGVFDQSSYDLCPTPDPYVATVSDVPFKTVGTATLKANIYVPPVALGPTFPAIVLAHGGGWWRGCRTTNAPEAAHLAGTDSCMSCTPYPLPHHYIVLAIDYRLACDRNDPNLVGSPILPFCGWFYNAPTDPGLDGIDHGAAIHDVESAIGWAKSYLTQHYGSLWNGKIAVVGNSAGGTLAHNAVARWKTPQGTAQVGAVGAWSGSLQFDVMTDTGWPCWTSTDSITEIKLGDLCKSNVSTYLGCNNPQHQYPWPACEDAPLGNGRYKEASPLNDFDALDANFVPTFFSNGGGDGTGTGTCSHDITKVEYLVACVSAQDFAGKLDSKGWDPAKFYMCIVDRPEHAQTIIYDYPCDTDASGDTVLVHMVNKFAGWGVS